MTPTATAAQKNESAKPPEQLKQEPPRFELPTEKSKPSLSLENMKVCLYGPPKIGKSTLAASIDPDHTIFLATEPGLGGLEVFESPIGSWRDFREVGAVLAEGNHPFKIAVVDTVDELVGMCAGHVLEGLAEGNEQEARRFLHASDFDYGKGWDAIKGEFQLRVGRLCSLGMGVIFISHDRENTLTDRVGRERTVLGPRVGQKGPRTWLLGYVDYIFYLAQEGDERVLHTRPTENFEAGGRGVELPDPLPVPAPPANPAEPLKAALEDATKKLQSAGEKKGQGKAS
jgi:hypothetical protein